MTLETSLRKFWLLPSFIQTGNGEPRKAHYLGKSQPELDQKQDSGGKQDNTPKKNTSGKYRPLSDITLGEVEDVYNYFKNQLVASPVDGWVAKNYFCQIPLKPKYEEERPPMVFGRISTCYPSEGNLQNIEQVEMYFPRKDAPPDLLNIRDTDLALQRASHSYCIGVKMYLSEREQMDFSHSENIFIEKGFAPLYNIGYSELLDLREQNKASLFDLYVIGSEWFASIPDSLQMEIREQIRNLARWKKAVLNYHPRRYSLQYRSLNDELDFNYGFTEHFLMMPQDTNQALLKLDETFAEFFRRPMS